MESLKRDEWELPEALRPQQSRFNFDLQSIYRSAVLVHTKASEDGYTASDLGPERLGSGVVIRSAERKLILTIGYLITEAESIWLTTFDGKVVEACPLAHDQVSGFGLVQPLGKLDVPPIERGTASSLAIGDKVIVVGHGGERHSLEAQLIARREFAGYWEYLLEEALFTAPPHPQWGGTALIGADGLLIGIGSLFVQESLAQESFDANMFVPIDLLEPILEDMIELGRPRRHPRPWLGMYAAEQADHVIVAGVTPGGPSDKAGVRVGDVIVEAVTRKVRTLPELFRTVWASGEAGIDVPLKVNRGEATLHIAVRSATRDEFLKKPMRH